MTQVLRGLSQLFTGHLGASVTRLPLGYITNGQVDTARFSYLPAHTHNGFDNF